MNSEVPLLVDLDGSLVKTDTLYEVAVLFFKSKPWLFFLPIIWFFQGKHILKRKLSELTNLNMASLPINQDVLDYVDEQKKLGRPIILCTGCYESNALKIKDAYPVFDEVIATGKDFNLTGSNKAKVLEQRFGAKNFDYLGNEEKDLAIWKIARKAIVVGTPRLAQQAEKVSELAAVLPTSKATLKTYLKAIRLHQWAKNALLFVPLFVAHKAGDVHAVSQTFVAFLAFSICASATYLLNDIFDLESDRKHPTKRKRPIASGAISIKNGIILMKLLMIVGLVLALTLNAYFVGTLLIYLLVTILYSFKLKKLATVDVLVLAGLFTIRVIAGGAAIAVEPSFWLLSFSMFIFLSLALVKRVSELVRAEEEQKANPVDDNKISGRGYYTSDITVLQTLGSTAGFMAVLVMAFYINSDDVVALYHSPKILWLICPALGYWVMRMWMLTARGQMNEDPISFAITDKNSWCVGVIVGILSVLATVL